MTTAELIAGVSEDSKYSKKATEDVIKALVGRVMKGLVDGETVTIVGFGKFTVKATAARKVGMNPATNQPYDVPAGKKVAFKCAKALKDAVQ